MSPTSHFFEFLSVMMMMMMMILFDKIFSGYKPQKTWST